MQEKSKIQRKKSVVARRAWDILCMALLWARKGGIFKKRLLIDHLNLLSKYMKSLHHINKYRYIGGALHNGERELSYDDTPTVPQAK